MPERQKKKYSGGGIFYPYALITVHAAACRPVMQYTCDRSQQRNSLKNIPTVNLAVITNH